MMTGRERLTRVMQGQQTDRIAWTMLIDETTRREMSEEDRTLPVNEFCRNMGCDVMQFGLWTREFGYTNPGHTIFPETRDESTTDELGATTVTRETPWGILYFSHRQGHPVSYPVKSLADLIIYKKLWQNARVVYNPKSEALYARAEAEIGPDGICVCTTQPSPVQMLLQTELGVENFYYMFNDYPREMEELLQVMHTVRLQEYALNARHSRQLVHVPVENTSISYISPAIYEKYSLPQICDYVDILHQSGKKAIVHMCGLLDGLLSLCKKTGMDGIHALTDKPVGNTSITRALDVMGEDTVLMALINPAVFTSKDLSKDDLFCLLNDTISQRVRQSNIVLVAAADGLPTPPEHFLYVREWIEQYGRRG